MLFCCGVTNFALLKRFISIFLLFILLSGSTEFHHLARVPELIEHYAEHRLSDQGLGFAEFLLEHYKHDNPASEDREHRHLPFKSGECQHAVQPVIIPSETSAIPGPATVAGLLLPAFAGSMYRSERSADVWQPPQIC